MHYNFYIDEAGYEFNWDKTEPEQRYQVIAAVGIPATGYLKFENDIHATIKGALKNVDAQTLGYGTELSAKKLVDGKGPFKDKEARNKVRDFLLEYPKKRNFPVFVVVIDKVAHRTKYSTPEHPSILGLKLALERIQMFCSTQGATANCYYDRTGSEELKIQTHVSSWLKDGQSVIYSRAARKNVVRFKFNQIVDFSFQDSKHSLGIQLADIFASLTYQYRQKNPQNCGWWRLLYASLRRENGITHGVGYKDFPAISAERDSHTNEPISNNL